MLQKKIKPKRIEIKNNDEKVTLSPQALSYSNVLTNNNVYKKANLHLQLTNKSFH